MINLTYLSLGRYPVFRETLIYSNPHLVEHVIFRSKSLEFKHDDYFEPSLRLLSTRLPPSVQLPPSAEDFFSHIASDAIRTPSSVTYWRLYDLLLGPCRNLPALLVPTKIQELEHSLIGGLPATKSTPHDDRLPILSLGILTYIATTESEASKYFWGRNMSKTLNLTTIQAVWDSKPSRVDSLAEAGKRLDICIKIFEKVGTDTLMKWTATDTRKISIQRLYKRCYEDQDIHPELHLKLYSLLSFLRYPTAADAKTYSGLILECLDTPVAYQLDVTVLKQISELYICLLDSTSIQTIFNHAVKVLTPPTTMKKSYV
jgi:hypothetical protein